MRDEINDAYERMLNEDSGSKSLDIAIQKVDDALSRLMRISKTITDPKYKKAFDKAVSNIMKETSKMRDLRLKNE